MKQHEKIFAEHLYPEPPYHSILTKLAIPLSRFFFGSHQSQSLSNTPPVPGEALREIRKRLIGKNATPQTIISLAKEFAGNVKNAETTLDHQYELQKMATKVVNHIRLYSSINPRDVTRTDTGWFDGLVLNLVEICKKINISTGENFPNDTILSRDHIFHLIDIVDVYCNQLVGRDCFPRSLVHSSPNTLCIIHTSQDHDPKNCLATVQIPNHDLVLKYVNILPLEIDSRASFHDRLGMILHMTNNQLQVASNGITNVYGTLDEFLKHMPQFLDLLKTARNMDVYSRTMKHQIGDYL